MCGRNERDSGEFAGKSGALRGAFEGDSMGQRGRLFGRGGLKPGFEPALIVPAIVSTPVVSQARAADYV